MRKLHTSPIVFAALNPLAYLAPGHLCARRLVHLPSTLTAGGPGRGELPKQETEYAH